MTATYTFHIFSSLDGFGSDNGNWAATWASKGPALLAHRLALYNQEQRMILGAKAFREFAQALRQP